MKIFIKLLKLIKPESLARARRRIRNDLKHAASVMIYRNVFNQGTDGYLRDRNCYGK